MKGKFILNVQSKVVGKIFTKEKLYTLKIGKMCVEMVYSENNKSFNECMLNVLNQKNKNG